MNAEKTKMNACDLYGGKENILRKINEAVQDKLAKKNEEDIQEFERYMPVAMGSIARIISGEKDADDRLLDYIGVWLDIGLYDVVGEPVFSDESKKYWEQRMIDSPAISTGPAVTLDLYVYFIMIHELDSDSKQGRWWEETDADKKQKFEWWLKQQKA